MQIIKSHLDPRLKDYSLLKSKEEGTDVLIADNEKTAIRLLNSDYEVVSVFCLPRYIEKHKELIFSKLSNTNNCFVAEKSIFEETIGFSIHQGFLAVGRQKWTNEDTLLAPALAFSEISDSENMGSMIRSATAFGVNSLVFDTRSSSPYLRRSVRVSMGSIFSSTLKKVDNLEIYLQNEKEKGIAIICLSLPRDSGDLIVKTKTIFEIQKMNNFILVVGNDAKGIPDSILYISDYILYIPMKNSVDSLNVSHALAVALSHLL